MWPAPLQQLSVLQMKLFFLKVYPEDANVGLPWKMYVPVIDIMASIISSLNRLCLTLVVNA